MQNLKKIGWFFLYWFSMAVGSMIVLTAARLFMGFRVNDATLDGVLLISFLVALFLEKE